MFMKDWVDLRHFLMIFAIQVFATVGLWHYPTDDVVHVCYTQLINAPCTCFNLMEIFSSHALAL